MADLPKVTAKTEQVNILQSIFHFLKTASYIRSGASTYNDATLENQYTNLEIKLGFPEPTEKIHLPMLAIEEGDIERIMDETYGNTTQEILYSYTIHGFAGGKQSDGLNRKLKNEILNDVKQLFEDSEYIYYHNYPNFNTGADLAVRDVLGTFLPITGNLEADRHRFQITFDLAYIRND